MSSRCSLFLPHVGISIHRRAGRKVEGSLKQVVVIQEESLVVIEEESKRGSGVVLKSSHHLIAPC